MNSDAYIQTQYFSGNDVDKLQFNLQQCKVPKQVAVLFGLRDMDYQSLISRINQLSRSISDDQKTIAALNMEIESEIQKKELGLAKLQQKRYQLHLSRKILKQIDKDIQNLVHQKKNILEGDYEGQITLKMAQTKGYVFLKRDLRHAIDYLSSEINFSLKEINFNQNNVNSSSSSVYSPQTTMRSEISSLFHETVKTIKDFESKTEINIKTRSSLFEKIQLLDQNIKEKKRIRHNCQFEVNQLEFELRAKTQNRNVIKIIPQQLEEKGKGKKLIRSMKKEYYRLNWILNEFGNKDHYYFNRRKDSSNESSYNFDSSIFDSVVFDQTKMVNSDSEKDLDRLVRIITANIRELTNSLLENKTVVIKKKDDKSLIYKSYIDSFQNIIASINHANDDFFTAFENQYE